jgi:lipid II:glycine glycyltransferase (peptidoglycan interpeptide bridge formation enzyme)
MTNLTIPEWDSFIACHPEAHLLQTSPWGELKSKFGWKVCRVKEGDAGSQILIRRLFPGITMGYIPKGPVGKAWSDLLPAIDQICQQYHCTFLKTEPDIFINTGKPTDSITGSLKGFIPSPHRVQPSSTLVINLEGSEQLILGRMKQKTRYNINLAIKKGVLVRTSSDLDLFHNLMELTARRDQFGVHNATYYKIAYQLFHPRGQCELLLAEYEHIPLATLMVFTHQERAWYFYGGSSNAHRELMPNYLLQWEAMRWARAQRCKEYDLWGIPDAPIETLEKDFPHRHDGLWGVYRFKRGFGGELRQSIGAWDRIYHPVGYRLYRVLLKARKIG